jgi:outer membrane protein assembly factor BamB
MAVSGVVAKGVVYLELWGSCLVGLDAATGALLWSAPTAYATQPTVANGYVYSTSGAGGPVVAFDADGVDGCTTTTPRTCSPLFTFVGFPVGFAPMVSGNLLYGAGYTNNVGAAVWDATATTNCTLVNGAKQCSPLRRFTSPAFNATATAPPAVAKGRLYVAYGARTLAYASESTNGCTGTTTVTCAALRSYLVPGLPTDYTTPSVRNDVLYTSSDAGKLVAFDALGVTNCASTPTVCTPIWEATTGTGPIRASAALTSRYGYIAGYGGAVGAVDLSTHAAAWLGTKGAGLSSPAVAGDVLMIGSSDTYVYGFNALGCGAPTCAPLWSYKTGNAISASPAVSNGVVYVGSYDGYLYAFKL